MSKKLALILICFSFQHYFGQNLINLGFTETKIESGSTFKKNKNGKLDSIIVSMYAMNYGNALIFSKSAVKINITNAADENSLITIELKAKKQVRTWFYKNNSLFIIESFDLNLDRLPKNATISSTFDNQLVSSYLITKNENFFEEDMPDKTYKLFVGLDIPSNLNDLDAIFDHFGNFFSEEDALLKIFYGRYAEKFAPQILASLKTDEFGKIKEGIIYDFSIENKTKPNKYEIYKDGKIIKSGSANLLNFQDVFIKYQESLWDEE